MGVNRKGGMVGMGRGMGVSRKRGMVGIGRKVGTGVKRKCGMVGNSGVGVGVGVTGIQSEIRNKPTPVITIIMPMVFLIVRILKLLLSTS
jgi:hypothetical protein